MRSLLLVGVALFACAGTPSARAQIPVTDAANLGQQILHYGQMLKDYAQQELQYARQGQQLAQEAQMVATEAQTLNAFVQNPNLGAAMGLMGQAGLGNSMPVNPYAVQGLLNGQGGISGALGSLSSLSTGSFNSNSYYNANNGSWLGTESANRSNGDAGAQGIGMNALQQIAQHIPIMQALRTQLLAATTPKQVQDAQAALETEQVWATNMNGQIQASALMYAAQRDANEERQNQRLDQSIDNALNQAKTRGYWQ